MAIDFPNSPTDGQIFSATNGVVYKYSAAYTSWLAQNPAPPIGGTGDFYAASAGGALNTSTPTTIVVTTVITGNASLSYNVANGRWTPPAGRYNIFGFIYGSVGGTASGVFAYIYKNGSAIANTFTGVGGTPASNNSSATIQAIVDANGADYFELRGQASPAAVTATNAGFGAFPLTGMQGPTGGAPGPVVGDFYATGSPSTALSAIATIVPATIITGNSGSWYNTSTGRFTPPAGRYNIFGFVQVQTGGGGAGIVATYIYKNGAAIGNTQATFYVAAANQTGSPYVSVVVDANGSDYFELKGSSTVASTLLNNVFGAYPTQGMVGPQGPAGVISNGFRLISRVVPTAGQATVDFTSLPSDINDLQFYFDATPTTNTQDLWLQFYDNTGTLDVVATHYTTATSYSLSSASGTAPVAWGVPLGDRIILSVNASGQRVGNTLGARGDGRIYNVRDATRLKACTFQLNYPDIADSTILRAVIGSAHRNVAGAITGVRFVWGSSTFAAGGAISLWGSP